MPHFQCDWCVSYFVVSFALVQLTQQHDHALTVSNIVFCVHLIAPGVGTAGHLPFSASSDDHGVQEHFARLASLRDLTLHDVRTGELAWFFFLPSSARSHGCPEFVGHRLLPDRPCSRPTSFTLASFRCANLLTHATITLSPSSVSPVCRGPVSVHTSDLSHEVLDMVLLELRQSCQCVCLARTSAFRADSDDDSAPHRVLSVHTQRLVANRSL